MANIFGRNKLREQAAQLSNDEVMHHIEIVRKWHEDYHHGTLKTDKETSREQQYNQDFFMRILGYKGKPNKPWSFVPKDTTEAGQLPDAVISYEGENIAAVVELKGAMTSLDRPQPGKGNLSPVQQGFNYKTQYVRCPFVIVSNFWEFRLYQDNQLDYESWTLDDLVDPTDDYIKFKKWYWLLKADRFITKTGTSATEQLLSAVRVEQEEITKQFYAEYREARYTLWSNLVLQNNRARKDVDFAIEKTQKIIDRIVFICFAEDRGLLPDYTLLKMLKEAKSSTLGMSTWSALKNLFEAIDRGNDNLEIPKGYNGGLFKTDPELDELKIDDAALTAVTDLSTYDFAEGLSVTILGHIFEQSISDLEALKNDATAEEDLKGVTQSRRKKDGIFYTPDYIVHYIVENSLGAYLREHEERYKAKYGLKGDIEESAYDERVQKAYAEYRDFLRGVKVVDPACGSGAFLVVVLDYLLAENEHVSSVLGDTSATRDDYVRDILSNNIYGVDLNDESVEITKLSLWLKTAQKDKKLTALDANIRCGNSLIDDSAVAGEKAFNWHAEFPEIFATGGFDVVVGNPPYVFAREKIAREEKTYYSGKYQSAKYQLNTYVLFIEQSLKLLKENGQCALIVPNAWLMVYSGENLRRLIMEDYSVLGIVSLLGKSFEDANVETIIGIFKAAPASTKHAIKVYVSDENAAGFSYSHEVNQRNFEQQPGMEFRIFADDTSAALVEKMKLDSWLLDEACSVKAGLKAYEKGKGAPAQSAEDVKRRPYDYDHRFNDETFRYLEGGDVLRYGINWSGSWLWWGPQLAAPRTFDLFSGKRLVIREITGQYPRCINATILEDDWLFNMSNIAVLEREGSDVSLKFVLGLLNSKLLSYYFMKTTAKAERKLFPKVILNDLRQFPIKKVEGSAQKQVASLVDQMIDKNRSRQDLSKRIQSALSSEYGQVKLPDNWWKLTTTEFFKVLKLKLSSAQRFDLLDLWEKQQPVLSALSDEIEALDRQIDQMVYSLYGLTDDEIKIVEGAGVER